MNEYTKLDDETLQVVETRPKEVLPPVLYNYSFLKEQLANIQAQKDRDNALRDAEILRIATLILEAEKLGIGENKATKLNKSIK